MYGTKKGFLHPDSAPAIEKQSERFLTNDTKRTFSVFEAGLEYSEMKV